jgi:hypothetical protein
MLANTVEALILLGADVNAVAKVHVINHSKMQTDAFD